MSGSWTDFHISGTGGSTEKRFQSARGPLRHFATYGSPNKYRPVKYCNASTNTAKRPSLLVYFFSTTAMPFMITTTVKAIDSQRWDTRIHLFQFIGSPPSVSKDVPTCTTARRPTKTLVSD